MPYTSNLWVRLSYSWCQMFNPFDIILALENWLLALLPTSTRQTSFLRNHTLDLGVPTWQIKNYPGQIDLWEKDVTRHSRGIMHVWDAGAVPKNRSRPLIWRWLGGMQLPLPVNLVSQDGHGKEAMIPLKRQPHSTSSLMLSLLNFGILSRPDPWIV